MDRVDGVIKIGTYRVYPKRGGTQPGGRGSPKVRVRRLAAPGGADAASTQQACLFFYPWNLDHAMTPSILFPKAGF